MRIAFVVPGASGGGVRSVVRIASGLAERGHQVRLLHGAPRHSPREVLRRAYLRLRFGHRDSWLRNPAMEAVSYRALSPRIVGANDVVVGVGVRCVLQIADLPDACGHKVHNCRGVEDWIGDDMRRAWALPMPRIVVGSHLVGLMRNAGSTDPIYLAHNGIDVGDYYPASLGDARHGVGTVYHGGSAKDPRTILAVLNELANTRPDVPLFAFGGFPRPRGMPPSLHYARLPNLATARRIYSKCLVWFIASRTEGLSNPLLEAIACGCAVISTDCGGSHDIIDNPRTGLLVPVGDPDRLAAAIVSLLDDPPRRMQMMSDSRGVLDRFTWGRAVSDFEAALLAIVAGGASRGAAAHGAEKIAGQG